MTPTNLAAFRITRADKAALLRGDGVTTTATRSVPHNTHAQKRNAAIAWLGTRWVFHKKNRLQRLAEPFAERYNLLPRVLNRRAK